MAKVGGKNIKGPRMSPPGTRVTKAQTTPGAGGRNAKGPAMGGKKGGTGMPTGKASRSPRGGKARK